ncbi:MAG: class I SAM-dependent methyltransferase [Myxococcota bacterium]|nr:class I SAM-dependent methyltransferase [Myxococcales bacterium]
MSVREKSVEAFEADVRERDGYVYSTSDQLSCRLSCARTSRAVLDFAGARGRRVLDVGCGDGVYTRELLEAGAAEVVAIDAAAAALESAARRCEGFANVRFEQCDVYALEPPPEPFDVAVVRLMLHHLYDAEAAVARIAAAARAVVVAEPNGNNPVLKAIERLSPYHVAHEEKSYAPRRIDRWLARAGQRVVRREWIGLVPMFCPDALARACKAAEPLVERAPGLRAVACGQYVVRSER